MSTSAKSVAAGLCGIAAGALVATLVWRRSNPGHKRGGDANGSGAAAAAVPMDIKEEVLSRSLSFFGDEGFAHVQRAHIVVVGLGGVGSHAAHMLARSGVGALRVVDFDQVSLSSLNRHAVATLRDVGQSKAAVLKARLADIVPWCLVDARAEMFTAESAAALLGPFAATGRAPDYVLDCIDDVNTKADLIGYCQRHGLPIITGCAAGGKADPTRLHMGLLSDASRDPLASKMRWKLKKQGCSLEGVTTVYSSEMPRVKLLPLTDEQLESPAEFGIVQGFRTRVMPVFPPVLMTHPSPHAALPSIRPSAP
jgi:tRNA A37 threonylcarbamoyladenosine dehydratase